MSSAILLRRKILSSLTSSSSLEKYTWSQISEIAKAGKAREYFQIGETKKFYNNYEGRWQTARLVDMNKDLAADSSYGQLYTGLSFETIDTSNLDITFTYESDLGQTASNGGIYKSNIFVPTYWPFDGSYSYYQLSNSMHYQFWTDENGDETLPIVPIYKYMVYRAGIDVDPSEELTKSTLQHYVFPLSATELGLSINDIPDFEKILGVYEYYQNSNADLTKKDKAYLTRTYSGSDPTSEGTYNDKIIKVKSDGTASIEIAPIVGKISYGFCI